MGEGAKGAKRVDNKDELMLAVKKDTSLMICEYLPGEEFTVDCFTDRRGRILYLNLRTRVRIKSGISVRSKNVQLDTKV